MDLRDMKFGDVMEIAKMFSGLDGQKVGGGLDDEFNDAYCIIRTYSAGVWFGRVLKKYQDEVILTEARRLYYWKTTNKGISLSEVATSGLHSDSKVCVPLEKQWLKAVEIILCESDAVRSIKDKENYVA